MSSTWLAASRPSMIYAIYALLMRKTHALVQVAVTLLDDLDGKHWGYDTAKKSSVKPNVMYGIFNRMLAEGWLTDGWEESAAGKKRPARRYYQVTDLGAARLGAVLAEASRDVRFASLKLRPGTAQ